ncbi:MAG TPA: membrane protein insertion efficiency factor YidD [Thermoanaerobaculia bacterium]|nr:membrane protein insertion efficiency factor YidD [Thermoanaerobaculia bacterium]
MRAFLLWLLRGYKRFVSPLLPRSCRFTPTCSEYAQLAIRDRGVWRGLVLTTWRLMRCQPFALGGVDLP